VGLGSYSRELARDLRAAAAKYGVEALISDDHLEVEETIARLQPELVLGTQMERHTAKRLGLPCAVISAPVHVQDYPARYSPQMGFEGANVIFDTWVHPLMMGLEEHLLSMFREDFEFSAGAAPSHLGSHAVKEVDLPVSAPAVAASAQSASAFTVPAPSAHTASAAPIAHTSAAQTQANAVSAVGAAESSARLLSPTLSSAGGEGDKRQVDQTVKPAGAVVTSWTAEAEKELKKIPFFVRGKAKRNTERFAQERNIAQITLETLYDAKAHFRS
jgi:light-independent protochlorophyllide reductase subunit B